MPILHFRLFLVAIVRYYYIELIKETNSVQTNLYTDTENAEWSLTKIKSTLRYILRQTLIYSQRLRQVANDLYHIL
jgi:hypothetical protein